MYKQPSYVNAIPKQNSFLYSKTPPEMLDTMLVMLMPPGFPIILVPAQAIYMHT